jgi:dimethylargininase
VSPRLAECALTHLVRTPIDPAAAALQHAGYEQALRECGLDIVRLAPLPEYPDGVFVEDTALLLDEHAVITRPGTQSRAAEVHSTASGLAEYFDVHPLEDRSLDGGDVLRVGRTLYVGLSTRTDRAGAMALAQIAGAFGFNVVPAHLRQCLHLKTAATYAGADAGGREVLLYDQRSVDPGQFAGVECMAVDPCEGHAANALRVRNTLIMAAGAPNTAAALRARGYEISELDVSELQKAEAGVTCMSLISETWS